MLQNMHIKNLALIDEVDIDLEDGLNIITGETGAGKSIIIGSIGICLGGRFSKDLLRNQDADGIVELLFSIDNDRIRDEISGLGIDIQDDELLISRRLSPAGKTINRINGQTATTALLKNIAAVLIDLHAQHEQQTLLKQEKHLEILDRFGKNEIAVLKNQVRESYRIYTNLKNELKKNSIDENEKNKQMDFLRYEIDEIEAAKLRDGEDDELELFYRKASNSKEILIGAAEISRLLIEGGGSAAEQVGYAVMKLKHLADMDSDVAALFDALSGIDSMLGDFIRELTDYMKSMEFDDKEFAEAESRLDLINSLKAKYGSSIREILEAADRYREEYDRLVSYDEYMADLKKSLAAAEEKLMDDSRVLSQARQRISVRLCDTIRASLEELNFMQVLFEMDIKETSNYTENGCDEACFMISTNIGEPLRPLAEIASGGELSRVMLAIKSCLASEDDTPTLVFDEIDVGISGITAQKVGEKLSLIGASHQVICITHLAQIAALADAHYIIEKNVENNKTFTNIRKLPYDEQIDELARLIGGASITDATLVSARDMKTLANKSKKY